MKGITIIVVLALSLMAGAAFAQQSIMFAPGITVSISPTYSYSGLNQAYLGTMNFLAGNNDSYRYLNVTIPAGYGVIYPVSGVLMGTFTINYSVSHNVTIKMISAGQSPEKANFSYSKDGGEFQVISGNFGPGESANFSSNNLTFFKPLPSTVGYVKFELGSLGPLNAGNTVTVQMTDATVQNPSLTGDYVWIAEAMNLTGGGTISYSGPATVTIATVPTP